MDTARVRSGCVLILLAGVVACGVLGILSTIEAPHLARSSGVSLTQTQVSRVRSLAGIRLPSDYFLRLPGFRTAAPEARWWAVQRKVTEALSRHSSVAAELQGLDGRVLRSRLRVVHPGVYQAIRGSWLLYLATLLYCLIGWSAYRKHDTQAGTVLTLFCLSGALYFVTAAPIVSRGIALPFPEFRWLTDINYAADAGLITVVHFAFLFPERKAVLDRWRLSWVMYGYAAVVSILYWSGLIGYDFSVPFLLLWSTVLIAAFTHSILRRQDPFERRQVLVSIAIPALVVAVFIVFNTSPGAMGATSARFATFALFALLMPFGLLAAMDNIRLYRHRLEAEARSHEERENVRQALHDDTLNKLADIAMLSESSLRLLDRGDSAAREKICSIKRQATDQARVIRRLLSVTDPGYRSWEDFSGLLRSYGYDATSARDVAFDLDVTRGAGAARENPDTAVTVTLYHIFVEALGNALRHANPRRVQARLHLERNSVSLVVADDGAGFQPTGRREGHYGLDNMARRARAIRGALSIDSRPGQGTRIEVSVPVQEHGGG